VPQFVRKLGLQRHIHRPRDSALALKRDAHGAKCGRSFNANLRNSHHHQQFRVATFRAIERSSGSQRNDCGHVYASTQFQSQHCARLVAQRRRLQRLLLRVLSVTTTQSVGENSIADSATYTAPSTAPSPSTVTVTVTPQADPSKKTQASIAIQPGISVGVTPATATLAANHRVTLAVQVNGTSNTTVNWSVNGIPGGNAILGQICVVGSSPCQVVASTTTSAVDYLAPGSIPSPNPVSATVVSAADPTKSASAQITVINHVLASVQPANVTLTPLAVQAFQASVLGTRNQNVTWQVQGAGCSTVGACGTVNANGIFTAPASPPSPNAIQVVAISSDDRCAAARSDFRRLSVPCTRAPTHRAGQRCRSMEHRARHQSRNRPDAKSDRKRTAHRNRANHLAISWCVDRRERHPLAARNLTPLTRTAQQNACGADGLNSICFDQMDMAFTPGVLAFRRAITADVTGIHIGNSSASTELGQILDADIYFSPGDPNTTFATPQALASSPKAYDLESVLTHELGHFLGFSHSAVWSAMMFPYAPAPGTISGARPTAQQPDAPLADDDRTGLRVLYPDPRTRCIRAPSAEELSPQMRSRFPLSRPE
jgi:matrixin